MSVREMFLKEALKMTDNNKAEVFNEAGAAVQRAGYQRGMARVLDLTKMFEPRGVFFGHGGENEQ